MSAVVVAVVALGLIAVALTAVLGARAHSSSQAAAGETAFDPRKTAPPPTSSPTPGVAGSAAAGTTVPATSSTPVASRAASPKKVHVVITYGGYSADSHAVLVGGFADQVIEIGGTCTLTLAHDGITRTVSSASVPDAATTSCGQLSVPADQVSSGTWQATLRYRSATSTGTSASMPIQVP